MRSVIKTFVAIFVVVATLISCEKEITPINKEDPVKVPANIVFAENTNMAPTVPSRIEIIKVTFSSKQAWTVSIPEDKAKWCTALPLSGNAGEEITTTISIDANETASEREVVVTIISEEISKEIVITQEVFDAKKPTITVNATESLEDILNDVSGFVPENAISLIVKGSKNFDEADFAYLKRMSSIATLDMKDLATTEIPETQFINNKLLTYIILPKVLTTIGRKAFDKCSNLTDVIFDDQLVEIGDDAFMDCTSLTSITLKEGLVSIGVKAFIDSGLKSLVLPTTVTKIESEAFAHCKYLTSITLNEGLTSIGRSVFSNSGIISIVIPSGITALREFTFYNCKSLTSITLNEGLTTFGDYLFRNSGLLTVTLPKTAHNIGKEAFKGCENLTTITSLSTNPPFLGLDVFEKDIITNVYVPASAVDNYNKPGRWGTQIKPETFSPFLSF